jgi:predicted transcriptional regulator of viral defense system
MERSLSKNEAKVVLDLEWRGQTTVTLGELRQALGGSESYARFFAHKLVQKEWLERLRPGLFRLVPAARGREGVADANPLAAGAVLVAPYFFSFGTACTYHGLTEQVFAEVYIACQKRRRPVVVRGKGYVFVEVPEEHFFGFKEQTVLREPVQMATLERALLAALEERPFSSASIATTTAAPRRRPPSRQTPRARACFLPTERPSPPTSAGSASTTRSMDHLCPSGKSA